ETKSGRELWRIATNTFVRSLAFSGDATQILIGGEDGIAKILDVKARSVIRELANGTGVVHSVAYVGAFIITATNAGATIWLEGKSIASFKRGDPISATRIMKESTGFAIVNAGSGVHLGRLSAVGIAPGELFHELVYSEALSVDDKRIAVGFNSGWIRISNTENGKIVSEFRSGSSEV